MKATTAFPLRILYEELIPHLRGTTENGVRELVARSVGHESLIRRPLVLVRERQNWRCARQERRSMQDLFWTVVTIAFFAVSVAYVRFCDRLK